MVFIVTFKEILADFPHSVYRCDCKSLCAALRKISKWLVKAFCKVGGACVRGMNASETSKELSFL